MERTLSYIQSELAGNVFVCVKIPVSEPLPVEAEDMIRVDLL